MPQQKTSIQAPWGDFVGMDICSGYVNFAGS